MTTPADARTLAQEALREASQKLTSCGFVGDAYRKIDAALAALTAEPAVTPDRERLQPRVAAWMAACFGPEISADRIERNHRFIEEALELVQACGCTQSEAHQLVDYVYNRPQGDINQEVGGVMITLAALCLANGFNMHAAGETELTRVWANVEKIRAKQAAKPRHSPLPEAATALRQPVAAEIEALVKRLVKWSDARCLSQPDGAGIMRDAIALLRRLPPAGDGWRPIEEAIETAKTNDGWIGHSLFGIMREWGWEQWVGQCDAGDIWLGRTDNGSCFDTEQPTHYYHLPAPPETSP